MTLNDLGRALARYRPFILAVATVVLIAAFLPGKPNSGGGSDTTADATVAGQVSGNGEQSADGGATGAGPGGGHLVPGTSAAAPGGANLAPGTSAAATGAGSGVGSKLSSVGGTDARCVTGTGRLKIPSLYAPPCVPAFGGSNGGNTYPGVTSTTITIARPVAQPNAATQAILAAGGDVDTQSQINQTQKDYVDFFEHHFQTYGRKVKLVFFNSNVNPNDSTAAQNSEARADAIHIAKDIKAFMSLGDAGDPAAFHDTLVANHVMCLCTVTLPSAYYLKRAPYIWGTGLPDETQDYGMRAEMLCKEINPYPPKFAGEADLNAPVHPRRTYALMWPQDPSNAYKPGAEFFAKKIKDDCGITLTDNVGYQLSDTTNPAQAQSEAQTFMAKFKVDKVSDVIFVGDPITPVYFTSAATKQQYFPEWIQTGSALTDWSFFARLYDQQQWKHNFGFSALPDRVPNNATDSFRLYDWQFHKTPPAPSSYPTLYPSLWAMFTGITLAGPHLTPQTFQCGEAPFTTKTYEGQPCVGQKYPGMFGFPVSPTSWKTRVANPVVAYGDKLWAWDDYNMYDDGTLIWWDPSASGKSETGSSGNGLYRYVNGGKRYGFGQFPKGNIPWFNPANTVTIFKTLPGPDKPPQYPYACYYLCKSPGYGF